MDGFYFGGSIISKAFLRSSILYYDSVIHYDVEKFFRFSTNPALYNYYKRVSPNLIPTVEGFYKDTQLFRQEGLLKLAPLSGWTKQYRDVFLHLANLFPSPEFMQIAKSLDFQRLIVLHNGYGKTPIPENTDYIKSEDFGFGAHYVENSIFLDTPKEDVSNYPEYVMQSIGREVTYGLLGASEFGAIPFSDLISYTKSLEWLIRQLMHKTFEYNLMQKFPDYKSTAVKEIIKITVPNFSEIPDEELIEFRSRRQSELIAFRSTINNALNELSLTDKINEKLISSVHDKINPRISDLRDTIEEQINDLRKKRIENVVATSINIFGFAILPYEAVILSTMLIMGKIATDEIGGLLDKLRTRKNGLYLLWELNKLDRNISAH